MSQRFKGNRHYIKGQRVPRATGDWWLQQKTYGSSKSNRQARRNITARTRRALQRLETCALERIAHRRAAAARRMATVGGQNIKLVAEYASRIRNGRKMSAALQDAWRRVKDAGWSHGQPVQPFIDRASGSRG